MTMGRKAPKEEKRIIPLYFQTFGDMMMNMLTLFILLCSFANERQAAFFEAGRGSFIRAIESLGLPGILPSDDRAVQLGYRADEHKAPLEPKDGTPPSEAHEYDAVERVELEQQLEEGEAWIPGAVRFRRGSSVLDRKSRDWLDGQISFLQEGTVEIEMTGHTWRETDGPEAAWRLSMRRALRVLAYLHERGGIPLTRLHARACGDTRPLAPEGSDPGLNRRVNIKLSKIR